MSISRFFFPSMCNLSAKKLSNDSVRILLVFCHGRYKSYTNFNRFLFLFFQVMYYYETLNSIDYKGSMTSLQSCQSGFSSISRHSTSGVSSTMSSSHSEKFPKCLLDNSDGKGKQLL